MFFQSSHKMAIRSVMAAMIACFCVSAFTDAGRAQSVADFYRGKVIHVVIGINVGGGYDQEGRLVAQFLGAHIPGNPTIIAENMVGAGGIIMANYFSGPAPQDGTYIGVFPQTLVLAQAVAAEGVRYDETRIHWIGSLNPTNSTMAVWHTSGISSIQDAMKRSVVVAGSNKGADTYNYPRLLNDVLGTRFNLVSGYQGNGTMMMAMESGEVQGVTNSWESWKYTHPEWVNERKIKILVQSEPKATDLPGVPSVQELTKSQEDREVADLVLSGGSIGKSIGAPPNVPPERVDALRKAFQEMLADPRFLATARKAQIEIAPISGVSIDQTIGRVLKSPPSIVDRVRKIIEG
jgi:tripartite-type tricarboxylate transporter receptor subunit TctC